MGTVFRCNHCGNIPNFVGVLSGASELHIYTCDYCGTYFDLGHHDYTGQKVLLAGSNWHLTLERRSLFHATENLK